MAIYYPPVSFHFRVEFTNAASGDTDMQFQEISGLKAELGVEELPVGGENMFTYKLPGRAKYGNLILKRGMLSNSGLIDWFKKAIENFEFSPVDINVHLLDENHEPCATWAFLQAYPVKWSISDFKASENALAIETIELAYQFFTRKK
jgi:phage tail-like protein